MRKVVTQKRVQHLHALVTIASFAYAGVLTRVLLAELAVLRDGALFARIGPAYFLPNIVGTLLMGVFTGELGARLDERSKVSIVVL